MTKLCSYHVEKEKLISASIEKINKIVKDNKSQTKVNFNPIKLIP
jgi:hypothetical protein